MVINNNLNGHYGVRVADYKEGTLTLDEDAVIIENIKLMPKTERIYKIKIG